MLVAVSVLGIGFTAGPAQAAKEKKITSCKKDKLLAEHIQTAFNTYLGGSTTAEKMAGVQDGDKIAPISDEGARIAAANGQTSSSTTTYAVSIKPTCDGKTGATFTYDLAINVPKPVTNPPSSGIGLNFAGDAALVKGKWLISGSTVCDLIGQNPQTPGLGEKCLAAL
jgi:hypothetical protein